MAAHQNSIAEAGDPVLDVRHGIHIGTWRLLLPRGYAAELLSQPDISPLAFAGQYRNRAIV